MLVRIYDNDSTWTKGKPEKVFKEFRNLITEMYNNEYDYYVEEKDYKNIERFDTLFDIVWSCSNFEDLLWYTEELENCGFFIEY